MKDLKFFYLVYLITSFIFLRSSFGKFQSGDFLLTLEKTLTTFASKNPYPFYKNFLLNMAIPNSQTFGVLTMWGELLTGIALAGTSLYFIFSKKPNKLLSLLFGLGCLGVAFLNGTFWLAAGWTSVSTESLNLLLFFIGGIGLIYTIYKFRFLK